VLRYCVVYEFGDSFLHVLMCLRFGIELCAGLGVSGVGQHRWSLSCDIILEALYLIDGFLGVLCICHNVLLLHRFWIDVDVLSSRIHAGSWLRQHRILWVDCNLGLGIE